MTDEKYFIDFGRTRIPFRLIRSPRRKHLGITVQADKVSVTAPDDFCIVELQEHLRKKAPWIIAKIDLNRKVPPQYPRKLISGETLKYLGRQYQLRVSNHKNQIPSVKLLKGQFRMNLTFRGGSGEDLLRAWYQGHLYPKLHHLVNSYADILNLRHPQIQIRDLGYRWGSCGKNGILYFHWQLATLSMTQISFVCAHEVTHLKEPNHNARFQKLIARLLPEAPNFAATTSL